VILDRFKNIPTQATDLSLQFWSWRYHNGIATTGADEMNTTDKKVSLMMVMLNQMAVNRGDTVGEMLRTVRNASSTHEAVIRLEQIAQQMMKRDEMYTEQYTLASERLNAR